MKNKNLILYMIILLHINILKSDYTTPFLISYILTSSCSFYYYLEKRKLVLNKKNEEIKKLIEENNRLKSLIEKSSHKEILEGTSQSEESNKERETEEEENNSSKTDTPLFLPKKVNSLLYLFQLPIYNGTDVLPFRPIPIQKANTVIVASHMIQSWRYLKNKLSNINHEIRAEDLYFHCL